MEDFGLVDFKDIFENVMKKIGAGERDAKKRGEVAEGHQRGVVTATESERRGQEGQAHDDDRSEG